MRDWVLKYEDRIMGIVQRPRSAEQAELTLALANHPTPVLFEAELRPLLPSLVAVGYQQHEETQTVTWVLNASGHINSTVNDKASEKALAALLAEAVKRLPEQDVSSATFNGNHVKGDLRTLDLSRSPLRRDAFPYSEPGLVTPRDGTQGGDPHGGQQ